MQSTHDRPCAQDPDRTPFPLTPSRPRTELAEYLRDWLLCVRRVEVPGEEETFRGFAYEVLSDGLIGKLLWVTGRCSTVPIARELIHALVDNYDRARAISVHGATACGPRLWKRTSIRCCPNCSHHGDALTKCQTCGEIGGAL